MNDQLPVSPGWGPQPPPIQYQPPPKERKPFYRRVLFWVAIGIFLLMGGCTALVVGTVATTDLTTDPTSEAGISRGAGSADATADVKLGAIAAPDAIGIRYGTIHITNHSDEASDYYIELRLLDSAGTNIGMTNATADRVQPGAKAKAEFMIADKDVAKVEVTEVQRTASI